MQNSHFPAAACKLDIVLGNDGENTLEADGEADRGNSVPGESADEVIVASAACNGSAKLLACDLENGAGVVTLTSYK